MSLIVPGYANLLSPSVDIFALLITVISGYYMYRQKTTSYESVRVTLLAVYGLASLLVGFEFIRLNITTGDQMSVYTIGSTTLVLLCALLLSLASVATYLKPSGSGFKEQALDIMKRHPKHFAIFAIFTSLIIFAGVSLILFTPYTIVRLDNLWGVTVFSTNFTFSYLVTLLVILGFFLAYPTPLLVLSARQAANKAVKRSLIILAVCWAGIGLDFLVFDGYLWTVGIDANDMMYLVFSLVFSVTAVIFRNASTLSGFFESGLAATEAPRAATTSQPFSKQIGVDSQYLQGRNFLLEVDPSAPYERTLRDLAEEFVSLKHIVFVFTCKGSPIHKLLSQVPDVKFYIMMTDVSYPKPTDKPNEILVPEHDQAVLLDLLNKTVKSTEGAGITLIFDNITNMILSSGFDNCYKFIKHANEIMSEPRVTSVFLLTLAAHDEKMVRIIKSLFSDHLVQESSGLKITRKIEA
ncbi:MAG TPA: hypothetical protein VJN71_04785 [Nitrososphaerales archaeon]|nr:hypothetical protein [Nitrososphaerales archaeon]